MRNWKLFGRFAAAGSVGLAQVASGQCNPAWDTAPASPLGVSFSPRGAVVHDDGSGPAFFVTGPYSGPSGVENILAKWNGSTWESLGSFPSGARVNALGSFNGDLYVGGQFSSVGGEPASNIARWDGSSWAAVGGGLPGLSVSRIREVTFQGQTKMYVGVFTSGMRVWDGARWEVVGDLTGSVNDIMAWDSGAGELLYAAGQSMTAGGRAVDGIAEYDGDVWSALADGQGLTGGFGRGASLAVYDDGAGEQLYVGGDFLQAGIEPALNVARWDGSDFSAVGAGFDANVVDLLVADVGNGPTLFAGGGFFFSGFTQVNLVAQLDPAEGWSGLGHGLGGGTVPNVTRFGFIDDADGKWLYVAGGFTDVEFTSGATVARWGCADAGCYADCDESGALNFFDFLCFQNAFAAGEPYADCDGSGELDFFDFLCFQNEFAAGCP